MPTQGGGTPAKKTPAKRAPRKVTPKVTPEVSHDAKVVVYTEEQKQAKLTAYHALKSAGLDIPQELAQEVEGWVAELNAKREVEAQAQAAQVAAHQEQVAEANKNGPWYVRNGYPAPFNFRLDRQTEKRRIELKPRGKPGDMHPLKEEDLKDPILRANLNLGLLELIPAGEAQLIIDKQTTNMATRVHTPLAVLRNELNQPYAQGAVKVEAEFNSQGVTVATLDPNQMQGHVEDKRVQVTRFNPLAPQQPQQQPQQATSVVSAFVPTGGNPAIISQGGFDNVRAKAVDDLARRKGLGGPAAGLGGDITVTVAPVQKS